MDYSYISNNTKTFLKRNQSHILKLKEMLKEQEESQKNKLEEKKKRSKG
jgi:hypothetical protein